MCVFTIRLIDIVKILVKGSTKWFCIKHGLCAEGLNIHKEVTNEHASFHDYEALWGPKSINGFKVDSCGDVSMISIIQELYPIVYQRSKIANNTIGLHFAKGLFIERKGVFKINWVFFVEQVQSMGSRCHKAKGPTDNNYKRSSLVSCLCLVVLPPTMSPLTMCLS